MDAKNLLSDVIKKMETGKNQYYDTWINRLSPSEDDIANLIGRLTQNVGTAQREGYNKASEMAAQYNLPVGAEMAMNRGTDLATQRAVSEGSFGIDKYADQAKREGWNKLFQADLQREGWARQQEMADEQWWSQLLQSVGGSIPLLSMAFGGVPSGGGGDY